MDQRIMVLDEDYMEAEPFMSSPQRVYSLPAGSSWIQSHPQVACDQSPLLGLKLSRTPSFLDKLEQLGQKQNSRGQYQPNYNSGYAAVKGKSKDSLQNANKVKAESCLISLLRVGSWQRVSRNEGDLVAKFYFAKRKLVWEILECGLKSKIEIQWSEILSLKAVMPQDQPAILQIELNQPPSFHHEIDPQPRKHTQWRMASDFTGGQALTVRRHYIQFPCGALDKPLEKLLRCDNRLYQLSRQGFPALDSPYFPPQTNGTGFSFDFGGQTSNVNPNHPQQFAILDVPTQYLSQQYQSYEQTAQKSLITVNEDSGSPMSVMDFSHIDEHISNNQISLWDQGMNNVRDSLITNQVGEIAVSATPIGQANSTISLRSNYVQLGGLLPAPSTSQMVSLQEAGRHASRFQALNDLQDPLMSNFQTEFSNALAWANLSGEGSHISSAGNITATYGQDMVDNNLGVMNNSWSSNAVSSIYPQLASGLQPQIPNEIMSMNPLPAGNNPSYSSAVADLAMGYFPSDNGISEANNWTWKSG